MTLVEKWGKYNSTYLGVEWRKEQWSKAEDWAEIVKAKVHICGAAQVHEHDTVLG